MSGQPNPLSTVYATKRRRRSNKRSATRWLTLYLSLITFVIYIYIKDLREHLEVFEYYIFEIKFRIHVDISSNMIRNSSVFIVYLLDKTSYENSTKPDKSCYFCHYCTV